MDKVQDIVNEITSGVKTQLAKDTRKKSNTMVRVLAVIGFIVVVAGACYALYRFLQPDEYEDYDDDVYDDDYEDEDGTVD